MNKKLTWIVVIALSVQALFMIGLLRTHQPLASLDGDSLDYVRTAENFLHKDIWSASSQEYPKPDNFRTPVYPLLLAFFIYFNIPFWSIAVIQSLLVVVLAGIVYSAGRRIVSEPAAFAAALVIGIEPYLASTFVAKVLMTEAMATLFLFLTLWNFVRYVQTAQWRFLAWAAGLLAVTALTKPQFFFFFIIIPVAMWCAGELRGWKKLAGALGLFGVIVSPWLYYNLVVLGVPQFSSVTLPTVFDIAYRFRNWQTGGSDPRYQDNYIEYGKRITGAETPAELFEPHNAKRLADVGFAEIKSQPIAFAWYQLIHIPRLFYHEMNTEAVAKDFALAYSPGPGEVDINVIKAVAHGQMSEALQMIKKYPVWIISLALKMILLAIAVLAFGYLGIKKISGGAWDMPAVFVVSVIALYAALASPLGQHRYRVPIEPWLYLLAFESVRLLWRRFKRKTPLTV